MNDNPTDSEYLRRPDVQGHLKIMELLRKWDPIGVFEIDDDWPQDEYDGYSATIVRMLDAEVSERKLFKHLHQIETEHMGCNGNKKHTKAIAKEMIQFWKEWKT
jgi:hypothetical protein